MAVKINLKPRMSFLRSFHGLSAIVKTRCSTVQDPRRVMPRFTDGRPLGKKTVFPRTTSWFAFFTAFFGAVVFLPAFEIKKDQQVSSKKPVSISSHQLTFNRPMGLTLFTGNVKATHDKIILLSDEIHAMEDNREATANGHVNVVDSSQGITLTCGNLEYQDLMNLMTAHDHPVLTTVDEGGHPITVTGRQMEVDSQKKTVVINQDVQIIHKEGHAEAQKATFLSQTDQFVLEDDPKVYTDNGLLSGRRIISNMGGSDRNVFVEGMADAIFNPNGKPVTTTTGKKTGSVGPNASATPGTSGPNTSAGPSSPVTNGNGLGNNGPAAPVNPGSLPRSGGN
jgi:lipopolysaccharide export system protein LptA